MPGTLDVADSVLRRPVRLSWPAALAKMPSTLAEPEFATVIGMMFYGHRARLARGFQDDRWSSKLISLFAKRA
jgi:cell division ATPase FtsA